MVSFIQHAFHSGEWSPALFARVDLQKYRAGAARVRNMYVDYRGGVSTRQGTRFCNLAGDSDNPVRLIPFQATSSVGYALEFGNFYIRFFFQGAPVLEDPFSISAISGDSVTATGNGYGTGDEVFIGSQFFYVNTTGDTFTVTDMWGNPGAPSGTEVQRIYTLSSPFAASDLFPIPGVNPGIKFVQAVNQLIICHPNYQPQLLTINAANDWTIAGINFGSTISTPTGTALVTTLSSAANSWNYGYLVTAVDVNGQESAPSLLSTLANFKALNDSTAPGTNTLSWSATPGAQSYNVYKANPVFDVTLPATAPVGFIGNTTALSFQDSTPGIAPDFSQTPPILQNPFVGAGVQNYTVTAPGSYTAVPGVTVAPPGGGGAQATASAVLQAISISIVNGGSGFVAGQSYNLFQGADLTPWATIMVNSVGGGGSATSVSIVWPGSISGAGSPTPSNPLSAGGHGSSQFDITWGVAQLLSISPGDGYTSPPAVTFSSGGAAATANLATSSAGNPGVPGFLQERLVLGAQQQSPMSFNMSQPGSFYNNNISSPSEPDDAITGTIFSGELNDIRSFTPVPTGLLVLSGHFAWIINGGGGLSAYNPITPSNAVANTQAFTGANDLPPLKINQDILYGTNKGNYVRDLNYNIYANVFSGTDISVISSQLFFDHYLTQWAWAEEPFKTVWAIREDGVMLSLAYVKDQETIGWARHDTNGQFKSVCSVIEVDEDGNTVDAVYVVAQRFINGGSVQYIERMANRYFPYGYEDSWSVDAALQTAPQVNPINGGFFVESAVTAVGQSVSCVDFVDSPFTAGMVGWVIRAGGGIYTITSYTSPSQVTATVVRIPTLINQYDNFIFSPAEYTIWEPITTVTNLIHLIGEAVIGVADGAVVSGTVAADGSFTLVNAASKITLGKQFTPQLQTLPLDVGAEPTLQGRPKTITAVSVRVADALGLSIGTTFNTLVPMKDLVIGNQNYYLNAQVGDLVAADARTVIDSTWNIPGQYCIQQSNPYPATILGVIPEFMAASGR